MHTKPPDHTMRRLPAPIAAIAVLAFAGAAIADETLKADAKGDARGGGPMKIDLKAAGASHSSDRLVHSIDTYGRVPGGSFSPIGLYIDTSSRRGAEYTVQAFPEGAFVTRSRDGKRTGRASYRKVDGNTVRFRFLPKAIGRPSRYGWKVSVEGHGDKQMDALPNRGYARHDLTLPAAP